MITIMLIVCCLLTFLFLKGKQGIEQNSRNKGILYHFYKNSLEFLVPFIVVTSLYLLLSLVIFLVVASNTVTIHNLIRIEETLEKVKSFFMTFKLSAMQALMVLLAFYFLGFLRLPAKHAKKWYTLFDGYQTFIRRAYTVLVLLCSFTFFGIQLGKPAKNIELHIKTIRAGYADLRKETREALSEEVAIQLYPKVYNSFPQSYKNAFGFPVMIFQETNFLHDYYYLVQKEFGIKDVAVEKILDMGSGRDQSTADLKIVAENEERKRIEHVDYNDIQNICYNDIKDVSKVVEKHRNNLKSKAIELLQVEGGKKITLQIPKVFTSEVQKIVFQPIFHEFPILEPVINVFFRTFDKQVDTEIEKRIDRVLSSAIQNPEKFDKIVVEQSSKIAEEKNINLSKTDLEAAQKENVKLLNVLTSIKASRANLFHSVSPKVPNTKLNSNLSIDINWSAVPDAQSYRIYWTKNNGDPINGANSEITNDTRMEHWPDEFPIYYRIAAIKGEVESKPSMPGKADLLSSQNGTRCQICGAEAIGYCHNRNIYVCSSCNYYTSKEGTQWKCP